MTTGIRAFNWGRRSCEEATSPTRFGRNAVDANALFAIVDRQAARAATSELDASERSEDEANDMVVVESQGRDGVGYKLFVSDFDAGGT